MTTGTGLEPEVALVLDSPAEVQGVVAAFDWDGDLFTGLDLAPSGALDGADVVVRRVEPRYMVLGVVMDSDGRDGEILRPGRTTLAQGRFRCIGPRPEEEVSTDLVFRDGRYGTTAPGLALDNLITVGGQTISRAEGLVLAGGRLSCPPVAAGSLRVRDTVLPPGGAPPGRLCAPVDVLLDTFAPVQGFVLAIAHDPAVLRLTGITIDGTASEASGADFAQENILENGGTLGVVLDLEPPFRGNTIPIGLNQVIARYTYCCLVEPPRGGPDTVSTLRFVDGVLGDPLLENVLVVGGRSLNPQSLTPGTFTCRAAPDEDPEELRCGGNLDPASGELEPVAGAAGSTVRLCFYYRSRPREVEGDTGPDQIQGLSMAVCYDPRWVRCQEGTFDIGGTITEAVGVEFVNHQCENSTDDGDPGELVVGILADALPPFDGHTLPPTDALLALGCIDFAIAPDAPCGTSHRVDFCDGADGSGKVPTRNLFSVNNFSVRPALFNCEINVLATPRFMRGDCNWSRGGASPIELADPAAMISFLYMTGEERFDPPCLDACDSNDDGRLDLGDAVHVLRYLFRQGQPPAAPGPSQAGPDPTADPLDCRADSACG